MTVCLAVSISLSVCLIAVNQDITFTVVTSMHRFQATDKPLAYSHFKAEGDVEFKSILFVPGQAPMDFMNNYYQNKPSLKLYVRRVFISDDFEDLVPK